MKEGTYKLILSTKGFTKPHHKINFELNRQIPSRSRMRLLQFNWVSPLTTNSDATTTPNPIGTDVMLGLMIKINNITSTMDYQIDSPNNTKSLSVLASIPNDNLQGTVNMTNQGSYEPANPSYLEISSPITSLEIELASAYNETIDDADISHLDYTLIIEVSSCECGEH